VDVIVTTRAGQLSEVKGYYFCTERRLVTLVASHRLMPTREGKTGFLVLIKGVIRGLESGSIMTLFAAILPRRSGELALVFILVAIDALRKLDLELCFLPSGNVA
jgi:hypothetical protein